MTIGRVATGVDQETSYGKPQLQLETLKKAPFEVQNEKEVFLDAQQEFIDMNQASNSTATPPKGPILGILDRFDQLFRKKSTKKVRN